MHCGNGRSCLLDQNLSPHCVKCARKCPPSSSHHVTSGRPVCGADGNTYKSACHLRLAACRAGRAIPIAYKGHCKRKLFFFFSIYSYFFFPHVRLFVCFSFLTFFSFRLVLGGAHTKPHHGQCHAYYIIHARAKYESRTPKEYIFGCVGHTVYFKIEFQRLLKTFACIRSFVLLQTRCTYIHVCFRKFSTFFFSPPSFYSF